MTIHPPGPNKSAPSSRSAHIMATARQLVATHASQQEIALEAGTSVGHARQATRILHDAPDLAAQVERGDLSIANAYRLLIARNLRSRNAGSV